MSQVSPLTYELRIGVAGHRSLTSPDGVRRAVDGLLDHLESIFQSAACAPRGPAGAKHTALQHADGWLCHLAKLFWSELPVCPHSVPPEQQPLLRLKIISPLASGADQLVAGAVLDRSAGELTALLPLSHGDYERQFTNDDDLARFRSLWQKATERFAPPEHSRGEVQKTISDTSQQSQPGLRNGNSLNADRQIVNACDLVIAVWDGKSEAKGDDIGDIVAYAVELGRIVFWINANDPSTDVKLITRKSPDSVADGPLPETTVQPIPERAKEISPTFHQFAAYLRDPAYDPAKSRATQQEFVEHLQQAARQAELPADLLTPILDSISPYFARADQLAIRYQTLYMFTAVSLYRLSAAAVTISVLQVLFFPDQNWLIAFEVLAMFAVVVLLRIGRNEAWHEKWLHDRHLAEQLRTEVFLRFADNNGQDSKSTDADTPLPFYQGPGTWVREAMRKIVGHCPRPNLSTRDFPAVKRFLIDSWIKEQADWHEHNAERKHKAAHRSHRIGLILFVVTLAAAILHYYGVGHASGAHGVETTLHWMIGHVLSALAMICPAWGASLQVHTLEWFVGQTISSLAIICPAWGAAVHAVSVLLEYDRIAKRSHQMAKVLQEIVRRAEKASNYQELHLEVDEAGRVMSTENLEWWISLRFRELVLPA